MHKSDPAHTQLILTKLYQPAPRPNQVERGRLVRQLNQGLGEGRALTLVSAPAGYGKSSLVAEWAGQAQRPVTWLSLDETDDDPPRFFRYFIAALQKIDAGVGFELAQALEANQFPQPDVLVTLLVNDLSGVKSGFLCVLDDFHHAQDPAIFQILGAFLNHQPPQMHLALVTREDPALPLARLRARGQLTEVRAADLRFSRDEIERFFRGALPANLTEKDVALLEERTEGWAAGLQLAGLSLRGHPDPSAFVEALSGSQRHIMSYLMEEVLKQQPPDVQAFLLHTAVLRRLNGDLCDAVTGRTGSAALLEQLLTANLFLIPLDEAQQWYRYHRLFADLLQRQLQLTQPEQYPHLHARASRWFENHGQPADAIQHALAGEDYARVVLLLETHISNLLDQGAMRRIETWLKDLPPEWRAHSPRTSLGFGWVHLFRGNFESAAAYLKQAEDGLAVSDPSPALLAECRALRSNLMQSQGRIPEALQAGHAALEVLPPENERLQAMAWLGLGGGYRQAGNFTQAVDALQNAIRCGRQSGNLITSMLATSHLVLMCLDYGRLRFAAETASQMIDWMENAGGAPPPVVGALYGALGLVHYEWNQVERSREYFQRGIYSGMFSGHHASLIYNKTCFARLLQSEGDLESSARTLAEAQDLLRSGAPGWLRPVVLAQQVRLLLAEDKIAETTALLSQSGVTAADPVTLRTQAIHLAYLRLQLKLGTEEALREGVDLADRILAQAEPNQRFGAAIQASVIGAQLLAASGNVPGALQWLERAITLAEPEGYVRVFIEEGAPLAALLRRMEASAFAEKLQGFFPAPAAEEAAPAHPGLIEPLTERELETLRLLAAGLTYAGIAGRLVVSVNTVRFHVKGIYGKLNAANRAQAIERARGLGLIS
jgi:LuxR family maltose regulon positive regulatory protein